MWPGLFNFVAISHLLATLLPKKTCIITKSYSEYVATSSLQLKLHPHSTTLNILRFSFFNTWSPAVINILSEKFIEQARLNYVQYRDSLMLTSRCSQSHSESMMAIFLKVWTELSDYLHLTQLPTPFDLEKKWSFYMDICRLTKPSFIPALFKLFTGSTESFFQL